MQFLFVACKSLLYWSVTVFITFIHDRGKKNENLLHCTSSS